MIKPILAWINCYGAWDPELRHPIETEGYDSYLNEVADKIAFLKPTTIYVSGGMRDEKGRTECVTTIPELEKRLELRGATGLQIIADEQSITSISIVKNFLKTWQQKYPGYAPLFFTDSARYSTNLYVLEYFAEKMRTTLPPISDTVIAIDRLDAHPHSTSEYQTEKLRRMQEEGVEAVETEGINERSEHLKH